MAKKKLNKQVMAAALSTVIVLGGGGIFAFKMYQGSYLPKQRKETGRALMLKGDYAGADREFRKAAGHGGLATDLEFLGWMYETALHRTSENDVALRDARGLLEAMLATRPGDVPTIIKKLEFDLDLLDAGGIEQFSPDQATRMKDLAAKVLEKEPTNVTALRADAMAISVPLFKQDTSQTSADIDAIVGELRKKLEASPDNPDFLTLYAIGMGRLRETLLREHAIEADPNDPRVKAMYADVSGRLESLLKSLADESKPADVRATGYARAARIDQIIGSSGYIAMNDAETLTKLLQHRSKSLAAASAIVPPTSDLFISLRIEQASALLQQEKVAEAETLLKQTIEASPLSWQPRLFMADMLSERNRAAEALEMMKADLKPSSDLVGLAGYQFLMDQRQIPLRRAFYRLQNLANGKPEDKDKEVAAAQADYDLAISTAKIAETDPYALQIQAAFMELKGDRSGALQTLTRALETTPNDRLKLRLQQQLVSLNLALNQPGAASAMLDQMIRNPVLTPQTQVTAVIQLIDLRIRNGATEQARILLEQAKKVLPGNPALMALEIKMMTDKGEQTKMFKKLPEDNAPQRFFKIKFAGELGEEDDMRRLATAALKEDPKAVDVAMIWGDYLRRHDKRDEAIAVFKAAQKEQPDNKMLDLLVRDTQAVTAEDRNKLMPDLLTPYKGALFAADQARMNGNFDEYLKKLIEAEPLDTDKDGVATERLAIYYMASGKIDDANAAIDRLAKLNRDPAQIRLLKIRLALSADKVADAMAQADALTTELPNFSAGWVVKGQAFQVSNQPSQAIDAYETALSQQPENVEALHGLVEAADRAGRRTDVKRYIDQGVKVTKGTDDFFIDWGLRYELAYGDPAATIEPRLKRRDASPNDPAQWVALSQSYLASAAAKDRAGDTAAAKDYRAKALDVFKEGATKFPKVGAFTLEAAKLVAQSGDNAGAMKLIDSMDSLGEMTPELQLARARFYADHGNTDGAIKLLQAQIDANKASDQVRVQLATIQAATNNVDGALKTLESVTDSASVREMRMNIYVSANRLPEAQALVDGALAKERSVPNILMSAMVQARLEHVPEAMKLADEAVSHEPENAAARFTRARIMLSERPLRNNDMIADLQVVKKNNPGNNEARLLLVERLRALSRQAEATAELEEMQRDFPGDRRVLTQLVQAYATETPPRYARIDQMLAELEKQGAADAQLLSLKSSIALRRGDNKGRD